MIHNVLNSATPDHTEIALLLTQSIQLAGLLALLTGLITNCAGSLACALTGCLALAATALLNCAAKSLGLKCLDVLHGSSPF